MIKREGRSGGAAYDLRLKRGGKKQERKEKKNGRSAITAYVLDLRTKGEALNRGGNGGTGQH